MIEDMFYREGCAIIRHNVEGSKETGLPRYREHVYASPTVCSIIWTKLSVENKLPSAAKLNHMLCALLFLKCYNTESLGQQDTKTGMELDDD